MFLLMSHLANQTHFWPDTFWLFYRDTNCTILRESGIQSHEDSKTWFHEFSLSKCGVWRNKCRGSTNVAVCIVEVACCCLNPGVTCRLLYRTCYPEDRTGTLSTDSALLKPETPPVISLFVCLFVFPRDSVSL